MLFASAFSVAFYVFIVRFHCELLRVIARSLVRLAIGRLPGGKLLAVFRRNELC